MLKPEKGKTFYRNYWGIKCTIIDIVADDKKEIIVFKFWNPHKKRWEYKAEEKSLFIHCFENKFYSEKYIKIGEHYEMYLRT